MSRSRKQTNAILDRFQLDLVVGTGGYASPSVAGAATKRGTPTAVHKSSAVPDLTTKTLSKVADAVMVGSEENRNHYDDPGKVVITGTPVCTNSLHHTRKEAQAELDLTDGRPLMSSVWGSLRVEVTNCQMAGCIALECRDDAPSHHIHGASRSYQAALGTLQGSGPADHPEVDVWEYIYNIPLVMVAADLVLCRTETSTIMETAAIAKPAVLVSSPNVVTNHQTKSARVLANAGGAVLLLEGESSGEKLHALVTGLLSDAPRWEAMSRALRDMAVSDVAEQIYQTLIRLMEKRAN